MHAFRTSTTAQEHGAFVHIDEEGARRAAEALPRQPRGPLHGIPVAVKDLIDVAGLPTALGRAKGRVAERDAAIVARLREQGAVIVGKTRTDELGLGALTPGASDPRDAHRSPGGSSGGSAIAVATGAALLALATDTAGSARIPAAACGVAGLCAAASWMPTDGVSILAPSFDRLGLIAATAEDLAFAWTALGGTIGEPPTRVVTLADDQLGRVEPERLEVARAAARHLSPRAARARDSLTAAVRPSARDRDRRGGRRAPRPARCGVGCRPRPTRGRRAERRRRPRRPRPPRRARRRTPEAVGDGVLVTPTLPSRPPLWEDLQTTDAQLRATGRLTRLCGPVNSAHLVAVSTPQGVQLVARTIETALAAALRLP